MTNRKAKPMIGLTLIALGLSLVIPAKAEAAVVIARSVPSASARSSVAHSTSNVASTAAIVSIASLASTGVLASSGSTDSADYVGSTASTGDLANGGSLDGAANVVNVVSIEGYELAKRNLEAAVFIKQGFVICGGNSRPRGLGCQVDVSEARFSVDYQVFEWADYVERVTGITDAAVTGLAFIPSDNKTIVYFSYLSR